MRLSTLLPRFFALAFSLRCELPRHAEAFGTTGTAFRGPASSPRPNHDHHVLDRSTITTTNTNAISSRLSATLDSTLPPPTQSMSPFAGMVAEELKARFGEDEVRRVVESWTLLDQGYEHRAFVGGDDVDPATSNMHQHAHSYVPGLTVKTFWDASDFAWAKKLEQKYKVIRKEFDAAVNDMEKLRREGNNVWSGALTDDASGYGEGWRTLVLLDRGSWDPDNVRIFPKTCKAIRDSGVPAVEAFFASMKPNTDIKPHSDFTNFVLTSHLAVRIPESGENKCRLSVGDDTRQWIDGQVSLFDTSVTHDAVNETDETRYILMFRVWHPDLTEPERNALQFIYDVLLIPELVSQNPTERARAEEHLASIRTFPTFKTGSGFSGGGGGGGGGMGRGGSSKSKKNKKKR